MLILLPPSETKRAGGSLPPWGAGSLSYASLDSTRERVVNALVSLSEDPVTAQRVLKLSDRQLGDIESNAQLRTSPTMPALDRYTGVLYDAWDAASLDRVAREWCAHHVAVHSAPLGLVGALDPIPTYRMAAAASLPHLPSLRRVWADQISHAIASASPSFVLDLRSEAYVALGPVPPELPQAYVRVVTESANGFVRALNHFNKHVKGELVRSMAQGRMRARTAAGVLSWMRNAGYDVRADMGAQWQLVAR